MARAAFIFLAAAQLATAHFGLEYPEWRADTLAGNPNYSQWIYPCANVSGGLPGGNRTDWPLNGGSIKLDLHHPWTYIFINLGLGENVTNFNYTLTPEFWNATGNGTLCVPQLPLPADLNVTDGTEASIQVVTVGPSGSGLYNCADITFRANAKALDGNDCKTNGVVLATIQPQTGNGTSSGSGSGSGGSGATGSSNSTTTKPSGAAVAGMSPTILSSVVGLAVLFAFGIAL